MLKRLVLVFFVLFCFVARDVVVPVLSQSSSTVEGRGKDGDKDDDDDSGGGSEDSGGSDDSSGSDDDSGGDAGDDNSGSSSDNSGNDDSDDDNSDDDNSGGNNNGSGGNDGGGHSGGDSGDGDNTGNSGNSGDGGNSGNGNSGNSGNDGNSGNGGNSDDDDDSDNDNSGNGNSGNGNSGYGNSGNGNSGNDNSGNGSTGNDDNSGKDEAEEDDRHYYVGSVSANDGSSVLTGGTKLESASPWLELLDTGMLFEAYGSWQDEDTFIADEINVFGEDWAYVRAPGVLLGEGEGQLEAWTRGETIDTARAVSKEVTQDSVRVVAYFDGSKVRGVPATLTPPAPQLPSGWTEFTGRFDGDGIVWETSSSFP
jgi:hypothetical protein